MNQDKVVLGYWCVRGRGQVARLLLAYTKANWEDVQYTSFQKYQEDANSIAFDFPNLPYLVDGDVRIS